jgi:tetratricopeptide (TPR) repeat protein
MIGGSRGIAALLASSLVVSSVAAEPAKPARPVSDKDKQVANDLVKKAIARSQAGDHSAAIDIYLQAYTIVPNSLLLSNIGAEFEKSGKQEEALHYFCLYLENDPNGTNAVYATSQAKQLQAMLGTRHVTDDNMCDPPKKRTARAGKPGRRAEPDDPAPAADDPADDADAPAAEIKHEATPLPRPPEAHGDPTMRNVGIGVALIGAIGIGVGVYAGIKAKDISDQISNQDPTKPWPPGIRALQSSGQNYEYLQIGSLIGGAAALGVGVYLILRNTAGGESDKDKADRERTVRVTPTTNGVAVFGKF